MKMNNKRIEMLVLLAVLTVGVCSSGCTSQGTESSTSKTKTIVDMSGRTVEVPTEINRIAEQFPAHNEVLLLLGAADKLVATRKTVKDNIWFQKMVPSLKDATLPFESSTVNEEELLATKPDVVFTTSLAPVEKLAEKGVPIIVLRTNEFNDLKGYVRLTAETLGSKDARDRAERYCNYFDQNINKVTAATADIPREKRVKVYYAASGPLNTEGNNTMVKEWMEIGGGINVAAEGGIEGGFKDVSIEDVVTWNPDIIIVRDAPFKDAILSDKRWQEINAVKNGRVYISPKGAFYWCVRAPEEALNVLWVAKTFYPDRFSDIDLEKETKYFYETFFGYKLSDEEVDLILHPEKQTW
ncbi:MAG: ABC transporter substrate-binding protein [Candidatus Methanofastidiosa archaeon]|jgi:iron complex transport system substrate-binding protein|nr:ABC transporter substrate-binding protein [Candidatus Methanofastidiosa archaeon]